METYNKIAYQLARNLTLHYSSSFGLSSKLFASTIRPHIYAIYGLVRIADEIVDTYRGEDARLQLDELEHETYTAIDRQYSSNPLVHAFALTVRTFHIERELIAPFFRSMRMDLETEVYSPELYDTYIHGSAEVVGLMCLRVFCENDQQRYDQLHPGASALGAAYQKINFLRDLAADYQELGRLYFPGITYEAFDDEARDRIVADIHQDLAVALPAITKLPANSRSAVKTSYVYYRELLERLSRTPASIIKRQRIRVPTARKLQLLAVTALEQKVRR